MEPQPKARRLVIGLLILVCVPVALYVLGIGCPIKFATGISCPGCGMTRAWLSALALRFDLALAFHPLFWLVPLLLVATIARDRLGRRWYTVLLVLGLAAIVLVWVVRLVVSPDTCLFGPCAVREDIVAVGEPQWVGVIRELLAH